MFVPQFGAADDHIYRKVPLEELEFTNSEEKNFERIYEMRLKQSGVLWQFRKLLLKREYSVTVAGKLLSPISL